ncbi:hypothetical protein [Bordetella parapertussis]|uniref:hypothetical protein n=1 Tax=Bordetella parapertussis TaxID=519 RepID=UPI001E37E51C|nr:hypothetical protein [Bordetella parapertussis]
MRFEQRMAVGVFDTERDAFRGVVVAQHQQAARCQHAVGLGQQPVAVAAGIDAEAEQAVGDDEIEHGGPIVAIQLQRRAHDVQPGLAVDRMGRVAIDGMERRAEQPGVMPVVLVHADEQASGRMSQAGGAGVDVREDFSASRNWRLGACSVNATPLLAAHAGEMRNNKRLAA